MTQRTAPRASLTADGTAIRFGGDLWQETFPIAQLPRRLAFYRQMAKRYPRGAYALDVAALEAVAAEIDARAAS